MHGHILNIATCETVTSVGKNLGPKYVAKSQLHGTVGHLKVTMSKRTIHETR